MGNFINMVGKTIGKIMAIELHHMHPRDGAYWLCVCDCDSDKIFIVSGKNIRQKRVLSCGCLNRENGIGRRNNLMGMKFGRLTVFDFEDNDNHLIWLSKCDCGSNKIIRTIGADLKNGKVKSCGCFRRKRLEYGENSFNRLYSAYKSKAEKKGFEFEFSKDEFLEITKRNCFYCGRKPYQKASPTLKGFGEYVYNGVDRMDNSVGYTKENSVPCCGMCNVAKNNHSLDEFYEWIKMVNYNLFGGQENV